MVYLLNDEIMFPDPREGEESGFFAVGGDLSTERLVLAYHNGIFPWYAFRDAFARYVDKDGKAMIEWWCPQKRFVIFPEKIHISHSMKQLINSKKYTVTFNQDFNSVIENCSNLRIKFIAAWLGSRMVAAYKKLHDEGHAISVEVWNSDGKLAGGLYGVKANRCICGESMFSLEPNTSKLALITLAQAMRKNGGLMIDCQFETSHLKSMGGETISYDEYMRVISQR